MRKQTPWGMADFATELAPGIISYQTPSHGGIWLSKERRKSIHYKNNFGGTPEWWEEDCDWAIPYIVFQNDIKAHGKAYKFEENLEAAKSIVKKYHPGFKEETNSCKS